MFFEVFARRQLILSYDYTPSPKFSKRYTYPQISPERAKRVEDGAALETIGRLPKDTRQAKTRLENMSGTRNDLQNERPPALGVLSQRPHATYLENPRVFAGFAVFSKKIEKQTAKFGCARGRGRPAGRVGRAVSYTHLTLPTKA